MEAFRPPAPLQFSLGNVKEKWGKWMQELENYLLATKKGNRTNKIKIAILLNLLSSEGLEIYNTFKLELIANFSEVLQKFEEYCSLRQNVVYERYKFFSCVQLEGQTIETCLSAKDFSIHVRVCRARKWIDSRPHRPGN
ncbi:transposon Ty3-G Gag-Pol polyprotein [Trichonephila clavipes]|uniref:Transposon Ty3-G Gag-Pol polyprotein n=1 Tax=Trichonephila clavipes TaxID=2585209 RepID=A0A8X7B8W4_TRICX|nr:transposon Ty3-G Gag-Pol polyprotein [Trichonephila clavipes]